MPTFVYMTRCDGCGHCVDICPSDIMHIDKTLRRATNIEPNMCWECYSCVKACPQNAIDVRGYADFAPLGGSVIPMMASESVMWTIKFRNGNVKRFKFPIRTTTPGQVDIYADSATGDLSKIKDPGLFLMYKLKHLIFVFVMEDDILYFNL